MLEVKQLQEKTYVQVNRKDPELICFVNGKESESSFLRSNVLWMVSLGPFILDLSYSLLKPQLLQLNVRNGLTIYDHVEGKF